MEIVNTLTLEDGNTYIVTDEIVINNVKYIYLNQENDISKFCIRKINIINGSEFLVGLNNKEEFQMALMQFSKKHHE